MNTCRISWRQLQPADALVPTLQDRSDGVVALVVGTPDVRDVLEDAAFVGGLDEQADRELVSVEVPGEVVARVHDGVRTPSDGIGIRVDGAIRPEALPHEVRHHRRLVQRQQCRRRGEEVGCDEAGGAGLEVPARMPERKRPIILGRIGVLLARGPERGVVQTPRFGRKGVDDLGAKEPLDAGASHAVHLGPGRGHEVGAGDGIESVDRVTVEVDDRVESVGHGTDRDGTTLRAVSDTPSPARRLSGLSIIVTGASSGIGAAVARRFAAEGARLTLGSRTDPELGGARWVQTDVADPEQADALIKAAVDDHGRLDVLVNNAGVQIEKSIVVTTDADYDRVFDVNVRGVFNCARAAVRAMSTQGGGSIINIGSTAAQHADHGMAVYDASKGAVHALSRAIAVDHGPEGIRCNVIAPGWITTELTTAVFDEATDPAAARARAAARHPVRRLGDPADVAGLAAWLAGPEASFANGAVFTLDGGLTAQNPIS